MAIVTVTVDPLLQKSDDEANVLAAASYVSTGPQSAIYVGGEYYDVNLHPSEVPSFEKKMVTWLNGAPRGFSEMAVAWMAVRHAQCRLGDSKC